MDKLRVAVIMDDCLSTEGGGYSYYQALLTAINDYTFHTDIEIVNLNFYKSLPAQMPLGKQVIQVRLSFLKATWHHFLSMVYRAVHRLFNNSANKYLEIISGMMDSVNNQAAVKILQREKIHLVYYLKPKDNLVNYPMIVTNWDVGHKSMFPFPEVSWNGNFEKRENYYKNILSKAFLILCESEAGARELQRYYPSNSDRVKVLPLFGGGVITKKIGEAEQRTVLAAYNLEKHRFYVYPAQFWSHKNHASLVRAFRLLVSTSDNKSLKLVLCGGDQGNLGYIKQLIENLGLGNSIILPGFIPDDHLYALYKNTLALVMPTFLGPTNIPLIEAAELECAVACSNLEGHKEVLGDNALYFDPSSISAIHDSMLQFLNNELREKLARSAYLHIIGSGFRVERSIRLLDRFLQQVKPVRQAWGMNLKVIFAVAKIGILSLN